MEKIDGFIKETVKEAGNMAMEFLGKAKPSQKKHKDFVTEADIAVEKYIVSQIREKFPDHNIVGEEHDYENTDSEYTWFIDPIDGTANYMHGDPHFAVSLGMQKEDDMIYGAVYLPMLDEFYFAEKGKGAYLNNRKISVSSVSKAKDAVFQIGVTIKKELLDDALKFLKFITLNSFRARDLGFCAGQLAFVAAGRSDALVKISQNPWDYAAGILLVEEAGGKVTDQEGSRIVPRKNDRDNIIATNNILHDEVLELLKSPELEEVDTKSAWF